ncbi:hypothetical protein PtA15_11A210 [Puccinia triticina]|uniref:Ribosome biogenesis protein SLX9 n=1 Tax=Puccinia triticina TaxID=208348 RepID=A0ABY7CWA4_9BASI|nr:uncharacterized protein PtA15_11A210 [Puccinia triticina]WAQ89521.1 hypothetical protein PtA15_11A210 [Puccinia triticina]
MLDAGNVMKKTYKRRKNLQLVSRTRNPFDILAQPNASDTLSGKRKQPEVEVSLAAPNVRNLRSSKHKEKLNVKNQSASNTEKSSSRAPQSPEETTSQLQNLKSLSQFSPLWRDHPKQLTMPEITGQNSGEIHRTLTNEVPETSPQHKKQKKSTPKKSTPSSHSYELRERGALSSKSQGKKRLLDEPDVDTSCSSDTRPSKISKNQKSMGEKKSSMGKAAKISRNSQEILQSPSTSTTPQPGRITRSNNVLSKSKSPTSSISSTNYSSTTHTSKNSEKSKQSSNSKSTEDGTIGSTETVKAVTSKKLENAELKAELKALSAADPKLLPEELEAVHKCISAARVPSWMT